ncbi:serine/threonine protein kinase [Metabacillus sp. YM-086]|uniref:serine/threonine protein kinase n=1 Tax=Metabacillus TaxID=2675233 RepID=UPI000EF6127B|nr:protein kinase family protein [Metabacillus litoralis]
MNKFTKKWIELTEQPLKAHQTVNEKYVIKKLLGKGSYGFTYLVKDEENQHKVLKQLRKYKMLEKSGEESFKHEVTILRTLNDSSIPAFYDEFIENQKHFIVMEYKQGKTYEELIFLENMTFSEEEALKELYDVLELVKLFHDIGWVHRDLRIPNILKNGAEKYIIDFGLARFIKDDTSEQFDSLEKKLFREVSFKSDFYALGHFLLFLLYSSFQPKTREKRSWEEELDITDHSKRILRKMLQLDEPYAEVNQIMKDIKGL